LRTRWERGKEGGGGKLLPVQKEHGCYKKKEKKKYRQSFSSLCLTNCTEREGIEKTGERGKDGLLHLWERRNEVLLRGGGEEKGERKREK